MQNRFVAIYADKQIPLKKLKNEEMQSKLDLGITVT